MADLPERPADGLEPGDGTSSSAVEAPAKPTVENRWWVETSPGKKRASASDTRRESPSPAADPKSLPVRVAGDRFFRVGREFDQDRAKARLTDSNMNWIREGNPPEDGWAYLPQIGGRSREELVERVKRSIALPSGARGVIVDSGTSLRIIVTGRPVGERITELTLGGESCFDAWVKGEWVQERVFRGRERALREASGLIARALAPED